MITPKELRARKKTRAERRADGECIQCGTLSGDRYRCPRCHSQHAAAQELAREKAIQTVEATRRALEARWP